MAMNRLLFPSIDNFKNDKIDVSDLEYVIIQEKLDGCNFRIIFNRKKLDDGDDTKNKEEIQFGSRNVLFDDKTKFHGYQRLIPELVSKTKRLAELDELNGKSFVIFGELVGSNSGGNPIIGRYKYFDDPSVLKFFAYEIFIEKDTLPDDVITRPSTTNIEGDDVYKVATRMDFIQAQKLLQKVDFELIPYTIMYAADYSYEKLLDFKSIYFNHNDFVQMEGYMLRLKFTNSDKLALFKLKPENLPEFRDKIKPPEKKQKPGPKMDDAFLDYISKVPYLDDDGKLLDSSYVEICMKEYQKETNITTKKEFFPFYRNLSLCCREKINFNELWEKFEKLVADVKR